MQGILMERIIVPEEVQKNKNYVKEILLYSSGMKVVFEDEEEEIYLEDIDGFDFSECYIDRLAVYETKLSCGRITMEFYSGRMLRRDDAYVKELIPVLETWLNNASSEMSWYAECRKAGVTNLYSSKNLQKAKLALRKTGTKGVKDNNFEEKFNESKLKYCLYLKSKFHQSAGEVQSDELEKKNKLEKYAKCTYMDKTLSMIGDEIMELRGFMHAFNAVATAMNSSAFEEKELDWAILGGMADGIAGPAAGIVTALDAQAKNAEIRARNEENRRLVMEQSNEFASSAAKQYIKIKDLEKIREDSKLKVKGDIPKEVLMDRLDISIDKKEITRSGSMKIYISVKADSKIVIFGDTPAKIDGTLRLKIYDGDQFIDSLYMVMPILGVDTEAQTVEGISLKNYSMKKDYRFEFEPYRLWAIEA